MKQTLQESCWQRFCVTGAVQDYLAYIHAAKAEGADDELIYRRVDHTGISRGRE